MALIQECVVCGGGMRCHASALLKEDLLKGFQDKEEFTSAKFFALLDLFVKLLAFS